MYIQVFHEQCYDKNLLYANNGHWTAERQKVKSGTLKHV